MELLTSQIYLTGDSWSGEKVLSYLSNVRCCEKCSQALQHALTPENMGARSQVIVAGATAGLTSCFCIAPLDVVKIQYHSHRSPRRSTSP
jgi:hypothetical protein